MADDPPIGVQAPVDAALEDLVKFAHQDKEVEEDTSYACQCSGMIHARFDS
jgi:hypothetical protein